MVSTIRIVSEGAIRLALSAIGEVCGEVGATDISGTAGDVSNTGNGLPELKSKRGISTGWERLSTFNEDEWSSGISSMKKSELLPGVDFIARYEPMSLSGVEVEVAEDVLNALPGWPWQPELSCPSALASHSPILAYGAAEQQATEWSFTDCTGRQGVILPLRWSFEFDPWGG